MSNEVITAWVTKYALTTGVEELSAEVPKSEYSNPDGKMIKVMNTKYSIYYHGKDWHRTPEAALARAEEMRIAKLASLRKKIAKLEAMKFEVPK